ncbi:uncharacterized protein LOC135484881 [Lineus longissimus]|uniref:uncharacterized protein LOC135484881 n=1 Tax=Lineus longissimus TaxID=88925 RepID=UPI00315D4716
MGLCKCPKKKVTHLFCFEHRVNVCERCLVANHPKCIVQSYLRWLQDSDYKPVCQLCSGRLDNEEQSECVRLLCYDVFHLVCLNAYARQLPGNTAPAGYQCPSCRTGIFPAPNVISPVAETLRTVLSTVNWARAGLGLPLIEEAAIPESVPEPRQQSSPPVQSLQTTNTYTSSQDTPQRPVIANTGSQLQSAGASAHSHHVHETPSMSVQQMHHQKEESKPVESKVNMDNLSAFMGTLGGQQHTGRKRGADDDVSSSRKRGRGGAHDGSANGGDSQQYNYGNWEGYNAGTGSNQNYNYQQGYQQYQQYQQYQFISNTLLFGISKLREQSRRRRKVTEVKAIYVAEEFLPSLELFLASNCRFLPKLNNMGLCKCPKKKVTNLFCFEHRVNVCEHCLVANHPKCIVQSYLRWLQDSDYKPVCQLCSGRLDNEEQSECVRLLCYDVFHLVCLNAYARQLPGNTAPAGYQCPSCRTGIFPAPNVISPVAETLRTVLSTVNWARAGLGLPLIEEAAIPESVPEPRQQSSPPVQSLQTTNTYTSSQDTPQRPVIANTGSQLQSAGASAHSHHVHETPSMSVQQMHHQKEESKPVESKVNMDNLSAFMGTLGGQQPPPYSSTPRKVYDTTGGQDIKSQSVDHDEDKYKRRPAFHWFTAWFKSRQTKQKRDPNATMKRFLIVIVIGLIGFLTVLIIFSRYGRAAADQDPFLDPMANPNIRINQKI